MSAHLPAYPFPEITGGAADVTGQLALFDDVLTAARQRGLVSAGPAPARGDERADRQRRRTAALRLWLLGYLDDEPDEDDVPAVTEALRRFQTEARLAASGRFDDATWFALDELLSFETTLSEQRIRQRWMVGEDPLPPLLRAAQRRLFALGLYRQAPRPASAELSAEAWQPFLEVNILFDLGGRPLPQGPFPRTLAVLFDQNRIVARLADAAGPNGRFTIRRLASMSRREADDLAHRLVVNVAKIELWLLGFDLRLDGRDDYSAGSLGRRVQPNNLLREALATYWHDLEGLPEREAERRAETITSELFVSLQQAAEDAEQVRTDPFADVSREVADQLGTQERIDAAWGQVQRLRSSLWDGLGRVWRWIKRGVTKVLRLVANLARGFFRYASKAFKIVRLGVEAVVESVGYYTCRGLHSRPPGQAVLLNATDFDATLYVGASSESGCTAHLAQRIGLKADVFAFGARIIGLALRMLCGVAAGVVGWARVLLGLVRSLRALKPYYLELKASMAAAERLVR